MVRSSKEFREALSAFQRIIKQPLRFINFEATRRLMKNYVKQMQMVTLKVGLEPSGDKEISLVVDTQY